MGVASLLGRILVVPVALSGVCLSMLFGISMVGAMERDQPMMSNDVSGEQGMSVVEYQDHGSPSSCCETVRMEHDTEATTPDQGKTPMVYVVGDIPKKTETCHFEGSAPVKPPLSFFFPHQPVCLIGTIFKRE